MLTRAQQSRLLYVCEQCQTVDEENEGAGRAGVAMQKKVQKAEATRHQPVTSLTSPRSLEISRDNMYE